MNSASWHLYPKGADFPRVADCPDCHATGLRINNKRWSIYATTRNRAWPGSEFYIECSRCAGAGKIIPPEWLGQ